MDPTHLGTGSLPPIAVKSEPQDSQLSQNYLNVNNASNSRAHSLPNPPVVVKPEPIESTRPTNSQPPLLQPQFVIPPPPGLSIKPEPQSEPLASTQQTHEAVSSTVSPVAPDEPAIKIDYTPENALAEGRQMAAEVEIHLQGIDLSTELRKEVWLREVASCKNFALPQTMIAVRGATGAGKSSLLNAILEDNIVPTSGMQACTAVVTEIRHHETSNIRAEVEFLSRTEWESELEILRDDLVDESGKPKRVSDLRSEAGIAWHKIHAVYPHLRVEQIIGMTPQQIIEENEDIAKKFDSTADIDRPNSEEFGVAIAPYIDSKDSKRTRRGRSKRKENAPPKEPALWPLIRIVRVWCKSDAISCGAVLVDLPGVADTNMARSNIAKDYMKQCQCIWIVAPITRAVDDKVAKDLLGEAFKTQLMNGNYDAGNITFIATKTDDISCSEVIGALDLWNDPDLVEIKRKIKAANHEIDERSGTVAAKEDEIAENVHQTKILKDMHTEYKEHLKALKARQPFQPYLTAPGYQAPQRQTPKKRKRPSGNRKASGKRARMDSEDMYPSDFERDAGEPMDIDNGDALFEDPEEFDELDDDDDIVPGTEEEDEEEQPRAQRKPCPPEHEVIVISDSDEEIVVISSSDGPEAPKSAPVVAAPVAPTGPITQAGLKRIISKKAEEIKAMHEKTKQLAKELAEAKAWADEPNKLIARLQMETNAFCSARRNDYSKDVLKEDFRLGLKQIDQAEAEAKNPETFDPATELRDYSAINLPVFTCSSRDYIRIQRQVRGDGEASCFTNIEDTEIPALQGWCHKLTTHARERAARLLLERLSALLDAVLSYVNEVQGANMTDRLALAEAWESSVRQSSIYKGHDLGLTTTKPAAPEPTTPVKAPRVRRKTMTLPPSPAASQKLAAMAQRARDLLEQEQHTSQQTNKSVSFRLRQTLRVVVEDCIGQMKQTFHDVIAARCRAGADKSKMAAVETSDKLADSVHWQTYRAVLRHEGEHRGDLNADLVGPMTREMAPSWAQVFDSDSDMFAPLMQAARGELSKLLHQIQTSAPPGLKDRCQEQCLLAFNEAHVTTNAILNNIKDYLTNAQKDISRSLTPHIKKELRNAYSEAAAQAGPGSVARQKQMFHDQVDHIRQNVFSDGANALFHQLEQAAEDIGALLHLAFSELSEKVEVVVSVLWDIPADNKAEMIKRRELAKLTQTMLRQSKAWLEAIENSTARLQMDSTTSSSAGKFDQRSVARDDGDYESDEEDSLMTDANAEEQPYAHAPVS